MIKYKTIKIEKGEKTRQKKTVSYYLKLWSSQTIIFCFGSQGNLFYYTNNLLIEYICLLIYKKAK